MANKAIQHLLEEAPRGQPMDSQLLRALGISPALAHQLAAQGWLLHLSRGAYLLKGDRPSVDGTIAFLSRKIPGLHVGGKTALAWQGTRHNLSFREVVSLWGEKSAEFPPWVRLHMPYTYQTTNVFDKTFNYCQGLRPLPNRNVNVLVSVPERALLEMASDIGKTQSFEEASNIIMSLRDIRPAVLDELLQHCHRVKVVRLVRDFAEQEGFPWFELAQLHAKRLGGNEYKRWSNRTRLGERLTLKPY